MKIGDVAARTGLTVRTLRYYEELGLVSPSYDESSGHRRYDHEDLTRLYRVTLLRRLGTPLSRIAADLDDTEATLATSMAAHLDELDQRLAALGRLRERVRAVGDAAAEVGGADDEALLELLAGMSEVDGGLVRRLTLLVYDDIEAAHDFLVGTFGFGPGRLSRDDDGEVVHGEVHVGDGVVWMHPTSQRHRLVSPATLGASTHCMAVFVDDVDRHHERSVAAGASIAMPPREMPYGVREYGAYDSEGGLWSFMTPLDDADEQP